jgi:uncharacterized protein
MTNKLTWFEIAVNDLDRAKKFYETVLDVSFTFFDTPGAPMYAFNADHTKGEIGGALVKSEDNSPSPQGTIVYFNSEDASFEAEKVEAAGGKLILPKMSIGDFGFIALFLDTEGNKIGLHSQK